MNQQPKPDSKKYDNLIYEIQKGNIKVPKFQRNFVWSLDKTAKLLDSILKSYPIGTFILWETNERLNDIKNIGNIKLPPAPDDSKVQYVLDGQQRITSLYAAYLGAIIKKEGEKKITDYGEIFVRLDKDVEDNYEQIIVSDKPDEDYISLNKVLNFTDNYDEINENYTKEQVRKILGYNRVFSTYDFSIIVLRKEDIDSAIEVFTRINTGGQTLTLFEIMSAKTYDEDQKFDMEEKFNDLLEELSESKYDTISSSIILNALSLILSKNNECKRKVILQLKKQEIIDTWDNIISSLKMSIDYFRSVYRIPVSAILPYDSLLVPFTYFFYLNNEKPKGKQIKYLEEFFWRMSLSFRYSSSTESKLTQDIKRIDLIISGVRPSYDDVKVFLNSPIELIQTNFRAGNSYCKAILCLLAYNEPKDFQDNGRVILDNSWLKVANSKNYHHFFPKAHLKKNNIGNENSLINITLVNSDLNKRKIRAKAPSIYIQEFLDENSGLQSTLKSHLILNIEEFGILNDDYTVFLEKRANTIFNELKSRIELVHDENKVEESIKELILSGENEKLELKSTLRYDLKEGCYNKKLEFVALKSISAFLNTNGGTLIIGVEDNGNIMGIEKDFKTLSKKSTDGFELHFKQLLKKYFDNYFEKYIKTSFKKVDGKEIFIVKVFKSEKPVFIRNEGIERFYVRIGNSSIPKSRKEQSEYEKTHWSVLSK